MCPARRSSRGAACSNRGGSKPKRWRARTCWSSAAATPRRILGGDRVESVEMLRAGALKPMRMAVRGVLVRVGVEPNTELFRGQLHADERGYVVVTGEQETSAEMVFAVGDVSNPLAPTVSGATGAGATAAKVIAARLNASGK